MYDTAAVRLCESLLCFNVGRQTQIYWTGVGQPVHTARTAVVVVTLP